MADGTTAQPTDADAYVCRVVVELVTDYLEDAMGAGERARFERHLHGCPDCVAYIEQIRRTSDVLGRIQPAPPSGAHRDALVAAFRDFQNS
jgi:anti-sigma factor RsiW